MRLLFFSNVFPSPLRPTKGVFNLNMVRALLDRGTELEVVAPIAWTDLLQSPRELRRDLKCYQGDWAGITASYPVYFYTPGMLRSAYGAFMWRGVQRAVRASIDRLRPDAIVGYWMHPDCECVVRAARIAKIPSIVMSGGSDVLLLTASASRRRAIERVLRDADAVVTVNDDIRGRLVAGGIGADKISVVRRGIDVSRFHPGGREAARARLGLSHDLPVLLWVGRVEPVKGLPTLIDALQQLQHRGLTYRMLMVGAGSQTAALQAESERRGIAGSIQWAGNVAHEELADYYRSADITVLPSLSEGVPNVLLESIACGTPFVASDVGGISEIATPGIDRLVPPGDAEAFAAAIQDQLSVPQSNASRTFYPDDWLSSAERLLDVIRPLVQTAELPVESNGEWLKPATV